MKPERLVVWIALGFLAVACRRSDTAPVASDPGKNKLNWLTDFETAKAKARAENKMLFINFTGSDWCPPCIMLHRQIFSQPEFAQYAAKHLVLMEVDFPRQKEQSAEQRAANEKVADQFQIEGFPTVIVLDSQGKKLGDLGYMPGGPKPFLAALDKLRAAQ